MLLCMDRSQEDPTAQAFYMNILSTMSTKGDVTDVHEWATVQMTS